MKSLYDANDANEIRSRLDKLTPKHARQWGRMTAPQALAHCVVSLEQAAGERSIPRVLIGRLVGRFVKPTMFRNDAPMGRNAPTVKAMIVKDDRELDTERARLRALIDRFVAAGPKGCTTEPHSFFGPLTSDEWGMLMYKHIDHHLRQFGA